MRIDESYRMLRDIELFRSRISKLDGTGDIGDYLVKLVNDKTVAQKEEPLKTPESTNAAESAKTSSETNQQDSTISTEKT